jgi:hypothetical protein
MKAQELSEMEIVNLFRSTCVVNASEARCRAEILPTIPSPP